MPTAWWRASIVRPRVMPAGPPGALAAAEREKLAGGDWVWEALLGRGGSGGEVGTGGRLGCGPQATGPYQTLQQQGQEAPRPTRPS